MGCYLVTGAAGFIGAALAQRLVEDGHHVVTVDNLSSGYRENVPTGVELVVGNCQDEGSYTQIGDKSFDAIFHIAGQSSGEISFDDPGYDLATNTQSTLLLLELAQQIGCDRVVFASTMSVYGFHGEAPIGEDTQCNPQSFYGVGKLASEHYLRLYGLQYGIQTTSLRLFNVYGPGQNMTNLRQGMVSIFLAQMLDTGHILVKGSPERFRDFVYIDDVVDAFLACLARAESVGCNINIATGVRTTVGELIKQMISLYEKPVTTEFSGNTAGDIHGIYGDNSRMKEMLGFAPHVSLLDGLKQMMDVVTKARLAQ